MSWNSGKADGRKNIRIRKKGLLPWVKRGKIAKGSAAQGPNAPAAPLLFYYSGTSRDMQTFFQKKSRPFSRIPAERSLLSINICFFRFSNFRKFSSFFQKRLDNPHSLRYNFVATTKRNGVTVARQTLTLFVGVRIPIPLPKTASVKSACRFFSSSLFTIHETKHGVSIKIFRMIDSGNANGAYRISNTR